RPVGLCALLLRSDAAACSVACLPQFAGYVWFSSALDRGVRRCFGLDRARHRAGALRLAFRSRGPLVAALGQRSLELAQHRVRGGVLRRRRGVPFPLAVRGLRLGTAGVGPGFRATGRRYPAWWLRVREFPGRLARWLHLLGSPSAVQNAGGDRPEAPPAVRGR